MSLFIPKTRGIKIRHQWFCLAAASICAQMDNWTLLSAGFDVDEEANGGSMTTAKNQESGEVAEEDTERINVRKSKIRKTQQKEADALIKKVLSAACLCRGEIWPFDSITLLLHL